jgi:DNA-binding PadR family transcriptional regulator
MNRRFPLNDLAAAFGALGGRGPRGGHHGHRGGFGGPGWGRGPWGGRGWGPPFDFPGRGPRARRGDIRAAILHLLADRPMHGYEMIRELQERSNGVWKPSAGSIYPTLQLLEDEGLVTANEESGKKLYSLTDAGRDEIGGDEPQAAPWEEFADLASSPYHQLRVTMGLLAAAGQAAHAANEDQLKRITQVLSEARSKIYRILGEDDPEAGTTNE